MGHTLKEWKIVSLCPRIKKKNALLPNKNTQDFAKDNI